jgi:hypothetical protein
MDRTPLTFAQSVARACGLRITRCAGPNASGLGGYACEACLSRLVHVLAEGSEIEEVRCSYCGGTPAKTIPPGGAVCEGCARGGLAAARSWYSQQGGGSAGA